MGGMVTMGGIVMMLVVQLASLAACEETEQSSEGPPTAASLAAQWQDAWDPPTRALPTLGNFAGGAGVSREDVAAFDAFFSAPFAQGMPSMLGLTVDGAPANVTRHRWAPFEVARVSDGADLPAGVRSVESRLRMPVLRPAVLVNISIQGDGKHRVVLSLTPRVRAYACIDGWGCTGNPAWCAPGIDGAERVKCTNASQFKYSTTENSLQAVDTLSAAATTIAITASAGTATPRLTPEGGEVTLELTLPGWLTVSVSVAETLDSAMDAEPSIFADGWTASEDAWEKKWASAFLPGKLPVLDTADSDLARVYYTSALSLLQLSREGAGVEGGLTWDTAHASAGTGECGGPTQYYWDTSFHAVATSLLEPAAMRGALLATLGSRWLDDDWICLQRGCGSPGSPSYQKQCFNMIGKYAFNAAAVFTSLEIYLRTTGDVELLSESVGGKTVDEWLETAALDWRNHPSPRSPLLADYGEDASEYLECVSTYIGAVPALQAHTVDMLRRLADLREWQGNASAAGSFRATATAVAVEAHRMQYNPGAGYWSCLYANGTLTPVRHCLDFIQVGRHMADDLSAQTKREMVNFAAAELLYDGGAWIRALALGDPVQGATRPDHGKWGAYAAWPPLVAEAFAELGDFVSPKLFSAISLAP
jgi:hypothetical protein